MKVGDYVRTKNGSIFKIIGGNEDNWDLDISFGYLETFEENWLELYRYNDNHSFFNDKNIIKSSPNIIDLVEYMDLLYIQDKVKLYGKNHEVRFFNPVRVDGFTEFEDGTHCIILNLDYFVDIKNLKIKGIITHEQLDNIVYKVGD